MVLNLFKYIYILFTQYIRLSKYFHKHFDHIMPWPYYIISFYYLPLQCLLISNTKFATQLKIQFWLATCVFLYMILLLPNICNINIMLKGLHFRGGFLFPNLSQLDFVFLQYLCQLNILESYIDPIFVFINILIHFFNLYYNMNNTNDDSNHILVITLQESMIELLLKTEIFNNVSNHYHIYHLYLTILYKIVIYTIQTLKISSLRP